MKCLTNAAATRRRLRAAALPIVDRQTLLFPMKRRSIQQHNTNHVRCWNSGHNTTTCRVQQQQPYRRFSNKENKDPLVEIEAKKEWFQKPSSVETAKEQLKRLLQQQDSSSLEVFCRQLTSRQKHTLSKFVEGQGPSATSISVVEEPSFRDLRLVVLITSIPFIGFGFMDNAILIIAGDAIDHSLGVWLGISTLYVLRLYSFGPFCHGLLTHSHMRLNGVLFLSIH